MAPTNPIVPIKPLMPVAFTDISQLPTILTVFGAKVNELVAFANGLGDFVATLQAQGGGGFLTLQAPSDWVPTVPIDPTEKGLAE